ncbi:MAG: purine-nucleoside phosphorylase [Alphaproteobacteria bacterium]|nr:MAG: purine-nucleoside phosphorylase [Alphaproteobacteria bacterium]
MTLFDDIQASAAFLKDRLGERRPRIGLVLGSGLNDLAASLSDAMEIEYSAIPRFPTTTVSGHHGKLIVGSMGGVEVACLQGRVHAYEGQPAEKLGYGVRTLAGIGVEILILTNAAGSLRSDVGPGRLMLIEDHINFSGVNPLVGENDDRLGPRFPDMTDAWSADLRELAQKAAADAHVDDLTSGVYLMVKGPNFETPAEIRMMIGMGAHAVGMSTVPECIVARHAGLRVLGISSITNLGAGMQGGALTHEETMSEGARAAIPLRALLERLIPKLGAAR